MFTILDEVRIPRDVLSEQFMMTQYMLIKEPKGEFKVPRNLSFLEHIFDLISLDIDLNDYVYLTYKRAWMNSEAPHNRQGWHIDGYGTDDKNIIWFDSHPTQAYCESFSNLSQDHNECLEQLTNKCTNKDKILDLEPYHLYDIGNAIHRVSESPFNGVRTFLKISISKERYNLLGNTLNPLMDYRDWNWESRQIERNHPIGGKQ